MTSQGRAIAPAIDTIQAVPGFNHSWMLTLFNHDMLENVSKIEYGVKVHVFFNYTLDPAATDTW